MSPLHNYPREVDGQCESCDCPGGTDPTGFVRFSAQCGSVAITCASSEDVPKEWVSWIQQPGAPKVYGESTTLGTTTPTCFVLELFVQESNPCELPPVDFMTVMGELGYSSPSDVPFNGYRYEKDPPGQTCCNANNVEDSSWPRIPDRVHVKVRAESFLHSGAAWWSKGLIPPFGEGYTLQNCFFGTTPSGFTNYDNGGAAFYDYTPGGQDRYLKYAENLAWPSAGSAGWSPSTDVMQYDYVHQTTGQCFNGSAYENNSDWDPRARVWFPLFSYRQEFKIDAVVEFDEFTEDDDSTALEAVYRGTGTCNYPLQETHSSCDTSDLSTTSSPIAISEDHDHDPGLSASSCNGLSKTAPDGTSVTIPRQIVTVSPGLDVSGTWEVKYKWMLPDSPTSGSDSVPGSEFYRHSVTINFEPDSGELPSGYFGWRHAIVYDVPAAVDGPCSPFSESNPSGSDYYACLPTGLKHARTPIIDKDNFDCNFNTSMLGDFFPSIAPHPFKKNLPFGHSLTSRFTANQNLEETGTTSAHDVRPLMNFSAFSRNQVQNYGDLYGLSPDEDTEVHWFRPSPCSGPPPEVPPAFFSLPSNSEMIWNSAGQSKFGNNPANCKNWSRTTTDLEHPSIQGSHAYVASWGEWD